MNYRYFTSIWVFSIVFVTSIAHAFETRTIHTTIGTLNGFLLDFPRVTNFLGIPYAESTAGQNRFKKPVPKAPFSSPYNATYFRPACWQKDHYHGTIPFSEDCLSLNVYVPGDTDVTPVKRVPVMVFVHGGSFMTGTSRVFNGQGLSALGGVIVVTINYRLNELGFLSMADKQLPGNYGLWDQQLAMKWVSEHITAFGGDVSKITIFGESAGARSVTLQGLYPGNKGLFSRVIAESGSSTGYISFTRKPNAHNLIRALGCDAPSLDPVQCLRKKDIQDINRVLNDRVYRASVDLQMRPIVDGEFLSESPLQILTGNNPISAPARDFFSSLDLLSGVNSNEGALYITYTWAPLLNITDIDTFRVSRDLYEHLVIPHAMNVSVPWRCAAEVEAIRKAIVVEYTDWQNPDDDVIRRDNLLRLSSDFAYVAPTVQLARIHAGLRPSSKTYLYQFHFEPVHHAMLTPTWVHGANHADELQFVFGGTIFRPSTKIESILSHGLINMWTNFAETGDPNAPRDVLRFMNTTWPKFENQDEKYLEISTSMSTQSVKQRLAAGSVAFWLKMVPAIINGTRTKGDKPGPRPGINPNVEIVG